MNSTAPTSVLNRTQPANSTYMQIDRNAFNKNDQILLKIKGLKAHLLLDSRVSSLPEIFIKYKGEKNWKALQRTGNYGPISGGRSYYLKDGSTKLTLNLRFATSHCFIVSEEGKQDVIYDLKKIDTLSDSKKEKIGLEYLDSSMTPQTTGKIEIDSRALQEGSQKLFYLESRDAYFFVDRVNGRGPLFFFKGSADFAWSQLRIKFVACDSSGDFCEYYFADTNYSWIKDSEFRINDASDNCIEKLPTIQIKEVTPELAERFVIELVTA